MLDVAGWYDAGKLDTLLETNRVMLERHVAQGAKNEFGPSAKITQPVHIADDVQITDSSVGPNVTIGAGSVIAGCNMRDTIVGSGASIKKSTLKNSLIGDATVIEGFEGELTVPSSFRIAPWPRPEASRLKIPGRE